MGERREELLQESLEYLLEKGVANFSLRPLAAAVGSSARLLVYHFGSKAELLAAVMEKVRSQFQTSFSASISASRPARADHPRPASAGHPMAVFWESLSRPANLRYLRLLLEVQVLALQNPAQWGQYLEQTSSSWLDLIEAAMPPSKRRRALATLCAAVIDGLILELLSTGDRRRTTEALDQFFALLRQAPGRSPKPTRKKN